MIDLIARIDGWAITDPDRLAFKSADGSLTYGELRARSDALSRYLASSLPAGAPVAIQGHKQPEMLVGFVGATKSGRPYIPIDSSTPPARVEQVVNAARAALLLTPETIRDALRDAPSDVGPHRALSPAAPYYLMFTSGSTGTPKGVVIPYEGLAGFVEWMVTEQRFRQGTEVFLNQAPFSFDLSVMDLYNSLATGGTLFSITADEIGNPRDLYARLAGSGTTVWVSTPSFAQLCLAEPTFSEEMMPSVRRFLFCGETLAPEVAASLLSRFPSAEVWNSYGPTEATVACTSIRVDHSVLERYAPLPVGYPMPGCRIEVMDEEGRPLPAGERGEIVIAGRNVALGYVGEGLATLRTAPSFTTVDGWRAYRTGDWGHFEDGVLFFEGRKDGQIKLHGYRIELADVESNLRSLPGVRDAVVLPVMRSGVPEFLVGCVVLATPSSVSETELARTLRRQMAERVPAYMVPRRIRFLDSFPMNTNGKVDRRRLAEVAA
ncbi:MAG TPA: D-alanine--poly(phosphoribitol) ligase subunit DltA [Chloroflexota bacterium]